MRLPSSSRRGVSLLESLIACTILFITVFALSQLMDQAGKSASRVRERSEAMQRAQTKLKELEAGIESLTSGGGTFEEDPNWEWSLQATENSEITGLWNVTIQVKRQNSDTAVATLSQIIIDPSYRGSSADAAQISGSSSSSSSDPSSSGQSGSTTPSSSGSGAAPSGGGTSKPSGGTGGTPSGGTGRPAGGTGGTPSGGTGGTGKPSGGTTAPSGGTTTPSGGTGRPSGTTTPSGGGRTGTGTSGTGGK